jgi:hypothetical protein
MKIHQHNGLQLAELEQDGPPLSSEQDALDIIGETYGTGVDLVAIPVQRFAPEFWQLRTGRAGAFIQKLVNYQLRLAIVGDLSAEIARSAALADFVREANRGQQVRFVPDLDGLQGRDRPLTGM